MRKPWSTAPALVAITGVLLAGCGRVTTSMGQRWGGGGRSTSSLKEGGRSAQYTIDHLSHNGRTYLVLAADGCPGSRVSSGPQATGEFSTLDSRMVGWACTTQDGAAGSVTIDGKTFDLAQGGLFLISVRQPTTTVEQIAIDIAQVQGEPVEEKLEAVGKDDPRVAAFLRKCRGE